MDGCQIRMNRTNDNSDYQQIINNGKNQRIQLAGPGRNTTT